MPTIFHDDIICKWSEKLTNIKKNVKLAKRQKKDKSRIINELLAKSGHPVAL